MDIQFRPHHFLCALCFKGKGYSRAFIAHFQMIMDQLTAIQGDQTNIQVVNHTDSICDPCPHRKEQVCTTEAEIAVLDQAHAAAHGINPGKTIRWGEAKKQIAEKVTLDKFHQMCATCSWKKYGICETVLTDFLNMRSHQNRP